MARDTAVGSTSAPKPGSSVPPPAAGGASALLSLFGDGKSLPPQRFVPAGAPLKPPEEKADLGFFLLKTDFLFWAVLLTGDEGVSLRGDATEHLRDFPL